MSEANGTLGKKSIIVATLKGSNKTRDVALPSREIDIIDRSDPDCPKLAVDFR